MVHIWPRVYLLYGLLNHLHIFLTQVIFKKFLKKIKKIKQSYFCTKFKKQNDCKVSFFYMTVGCV